MSLRRKFASGFDDLIATIYYCWMGSIHAVIGCPGDPAIPERLNRMTARSPHRGEVARCQSPGVAIAVQSLGWDASLADTNDAVVAFHGFVGNWAELGVRRFTDSDGALNNAATLAGVFSEFGPEIFNRLRGEFAAIIHDRHRNVVLAVRDVVGCRPLFFRQNDGRTVVASEIRQVVEGAGRPAELNDRGIVAHLAGLPQIDGETLYRNISCVFPGWVFVCDCRASDGGFTRSPQPYWSIGDGDDGGYPSEGAWLEELECRLEKAVRRSLSVRPSALALSGGLDSSSIWAHVSELADRGFEPAKSVKPITLQFPGQPCDESRLVEELLARTGHRGLAIDGTRETASSLRSRLLKWMDTIPYPTTFLVDVIARFASDSGYSVVYTGLLADDWFDVWPDSRRVKLAKAARRVLPWSLLKPAFSLRRRFVRRRSQRSTTGAAEQWMGRRWRPFVKERRLEAAIKRLDSRSMLGAELDFKRTGWALHSWEQIGAAAGIEYRYPFSDPDLISMAAGAPGSLFLQGISKPALRRVLHERVPPAIARKPDRTDFSCLCHGAGSGRTGGLGRDSREWLLVERGLVDPGALDSLMGSTDTVEAAKLIVCWLEEAESFARVASQIDVRDVTFGGVL